MDYEPHVTLRIPEPEDFDATPPTVYVPVPSAVVDYGIDVLQAFVTQWKQNEGGETVHEVWDPLAVAAAQMLSGLMSAWAAYYHGSGARELVEQIDRFCGGRDAPPDLYDRHRDQRRHDLAALREHARTADIVQALEALRAERQRQRNERQQPPPSPQAPTAQDEQAPAGKDEGGWDF